MSAKQGTKNSSWFIFTKMFLTIKIAKPSITKMIMNDLFCFFSDVACSSIAAGNFFQQMKTRNKNKEKLK
jgi:hypothetical protein